MKKILIVFLIISSFMLVGCNKFFPTNNETKQNDDNATSNNLDSTAKSEISKANKELENQGKLIIEKESFTENTFVSLKEMSETYNMDISRYISSELYCDEEKSGINVYVNSGKVTVEPYLYGCTIISKTTIDKEKELIDELLTFGKKLYQEKKYNSFAHMDAGYVISLTELNNLFNFDLTDYSEYDVDNSMIIIDVDNNNGIEYNEEPVLVHLTKKGN